MKIKMIERLKHAVRTRLRKVRRCPTRDERTEVTAAVYFDEAYHWNDRYARGGWLPSGPSYVRNTTGRDEFVTLSHPGEGEPGSRKRT